MSSYTGRQINVSPAWAVSGTAEVPRPDVSTKQAGLAIDGKYPYQTANWLFKTTGENIGGLRQHVVFSDVLPGFYAGGTIPTTGANFDNVRICTDDSTGNSHFVAGRNTSAGAYEVYRFGATGGAGVLYSNNLPAGFTLNDLLGDTLGTRHVFAVGSLAGASAAYIATAINTWSDVGATYYPNAPGPLHRVRRIVANGTGYLFTVGDNGTVFMKQNTEPGVSTIKTPPTAMSAANFRGIAAGVTAGAYYALLFGDSRHVMTVTLTSPPTHNVGVHTNALPSSVSSVNAAVVSASGAFVVAGGVRTDGKAFIAVSENCGASWDEVPPEIHGITAAITDMTVTIQGGLLAVAGGALFGGFPEPVTPWKKMYEGGWVSDLVNYGGDHLTDNEVSNSVGRRIYVGVTGTSAPRLPYGYPRFYVERTLP